MRRILAVLLGLFAVAFAAQTARAEEYNSFYLKDLDMEITLPAEFLVITRENIEGNPILDIFGYSPERAMEKLESESLYLDAMDEKVSFELLLSVTDEPFGNYSSYTDSELKRVLNNKKKNYTGKGATWNGGSILRLDQATFLKIDFYRNDGKKTIYVREYYTIGYGKAVNLTLNSYVGNISEEMGDILARVVNEIRFDTGGLPQTSEPQSAPTVEYRDELSGVTFTVPTGWVEEPLENVKRIDAKFVPVDHGDVFVAYTCEDIYGGDEFRGRLPEGWEEYISREEVNNSLLSEDLVAEMCGCTAEQVSLVTVGSAEYYRAVFEQEKDGYVIPCTIMTCYYNGYLFMYAFYGESEHPAYADFVGMIQSVEYPAPQKVPSPGGNKEADLIKTVVIDLIFSLLLTVAVYSLPIFVYRWCIRRYPVERKKAKIIAIVYGIAAWVLMSVIVFVVNDGGVAGGAVFLWSWINYRVLIGGRDKRRRMEEPQDDPWTREPEIAEPEPQPAELELVETEPSKPEPAPEEEPYRFCPRCGFELIPGSRFCSRCGTSIPQK